MQLSVKCSTHQKSLNKQLGLFQIQEEHITMKLFTSNYTLLAKHYGFPPKVVKGKHLELVCRKLRSALIGSLLLHHNLLWQGHQ